MSGLQEELPEDRLRLTNEEIDLVHAAFFAKKSMSFLIDQLPFALWAKDVRGRYVGANKQWLDDEKFAELSEIVGKNDYDLFDPVRAATHIRRDWEMLDEGRPLIAVDSIDRDGQPETQQVTRLPLRDADLEVVGIVGFSSSTSALANNIDQSAAVHIDPTTGVGVQQALHDRIGELIDSDQPGSLMLIRLDDYETVSDSLGQEFGDMLLRAAARRLTKAFGPHLFRNRSDEFAVVLPSVDRGHLEEIGEAMLAKWRQPFVIDGNHIYGSVSIGVAALTERTRSALVLQDGALAVSEAAKHGGSRIVIYSSEHRRAADDELAQQMLVRRAVSDKEFDLHWQPIVHGHTGQTFAFEALLRWRPAGGSQILPAAEFFPFLERSGLIVQLGKFVINEACRQHVAWREHPSIKTPIPVHINVSARQFTSGVLASDIISSLEENGVAPDQLTVEVVESAIAQPPDEMLRDLYTLRDAGVKIAIDDFGASHSSIASLASLPIDIAKVDRRLTSRIIPGTPEPILDAFATVFDAHGITPVAQGVESEEQLEWLRSRGWNLVQGYHLGEPLDAHDITPLLAGSSVR